MTGTCPEMDDGKLDRGTKRETGTTTSPTSLLPRYYPFSKLSAHLQTVHLFRRSSRHDTDYTHKGHLVPHSSHSDPRREVGEQVDLEPGSTEPHFNFPPRVFRPNRCDLDDRGPYNRRPEVNPRKRWMYF